MHKKEKKVAVNEKDNYNTLRYNRNYFIKIENKNYEEKY